MARLSACLLAGLLHLASQQHLIQHEVSLQSTALLNEVQNTESGTACCSNRLNPQLLAPSLSPGEWHGKTTAPECSFCEGCSRMTLILLHCCTHHSPEQAAFLCPLPMNSMLRAGSKHLTAISTSTTCPSPLLVPINPSKQPTRRWFLHLLQCLILKALNLTKVGPNPQISSSGSALPLAAGHKDCWPRPQAQRLHLHTVSPAAWAGCCCCCCKPHRGSWI